MADNDANANDVRNDVDEDYVDIIQLLQHDTIQLLRFIRPPNPMALMMTMTKTCIGGLLIFIMLTVQLEDAITIRLSVLLCVGWVVLLITEKEMAELKNQKARKCTRITTTRTTTIRELDQQHQQSRQREEQLLQQQQQGQESLQRIQELEQQEQERINNNMCSICLEHPRTQVCFPCGHTCTCQSCSLKLIELTRNNNLAVCPICRGDVQQFMELFFP
jgi:hypothetical protein